MSPGPQPPHPQRIFVFAGGGTGGHLYPALAIWEELASRLGPSAAACFVCSDRPVDRQVLEPTGERFVASPAKPLGTAPRVLWRFVRAWGRSVREGRALLRSLRTAPPGHPAPRVEVVSTGGFVSAPIARAAAVERVPFTLINLDAAPGKANRLAARWAGRAFTTFAVSAPFAARWSVVPPIVRRSARLALSPAEARAQLGLEPNRPTLLVTGGSQGAASINALLAALADHPAAPLRGWQVLHQTGTGDHPELRAAYARAGVPAIVQPFVQTMGLWWRAASLMLGRAGAGNVAEAWANAVPAIFLPYPFHRDQHQRLNALALEHAGGATILNDLIDAPRNLAQHAPTLTRLLTDPAARDAAHAALLALGPADGAARIADHLAQP
jgi:UDP-N-acetylglucosamine--N-acetylmuramyl-(pentapeptide) pyrophosphoryl-undecaprenol N-acetylglucosamine transferase